MLKLILGFFLIVGPFAGFSQINIIYTKGEKLSYNIGDTVSVSIQLKVPVETCLDGMNQTKLFQGGISIIKQSSWQEIKRGFWQKEISLIITGNKKGTAMLTVMRRNDKQSVSYQEQFKYTK